MMNRIEFEKYVEHIYECKADYPWERYPDYAVYRHRHSRKWFAVVMDIPKTKLGLGSSEKIAVVNLKCNPILLGSLLGQKGFFPAYHMNKTNWLTVALDGSVEKDKIEWLLEMSYNLTNN